MLFVSNQIGVAVNRKEDEQQIKLLFKSIEQSSVSVVITDNNGTIEYVNPKFTDVAGYSLEEAIGQNPRILKSGNQSDSVYKELWENISKGNQWNITCF
jgi:PAS domain S-box-containing protein